MSAAEITIVQPDRAELAAEYSPLVAQAESVTVTCVEEHGAAQSYLADLARAKRRVEERLNPIIKSAHEAHRGLTALRGDLIKPLDAARRVVSSKLDVYEREQRRIADEQRRQAEEAARKAAEERQLQDAIAAEEAGDSAEAEAILDEQVPEPVVAVPTQTAKVAGVTTQERWHAEVVDMIGLVRHVAENPEWIALLEPAMPQLNGLARSQRGAMRIPGVRAVAETVRAVRA